MTALEAAGYACVGKANLHEFAWGITSENDHYGWVPNPAGDGRVAGGSSGGCGAALAAGLADAALGSDSGGSIRIPAACCGVVGMKVSFGLVPIDGCWPLAPSYDTAGPMARDVAGCERMLEAMAPGFEAAELDSLADLRVGVAWTDRADPLVRERVEAAAALFPHRARGRPPAAGRRLHGVRARGGRGPRRPVPRPPRALRPDRRVQDGARAARHRRRGRGGGPPARALHRARRRADGRPRPDRHADGPDGRAAGRRRRPRAARPDARADVRVERDRRARARAPVRPGRARPPRLGAAARQGRRATPQLLAAGRLLEAAL